jgi:hypothetical protein
MIERKLLLVYRYKNLILSMYKNIVLIQKRLGLINSIVN